MSKANKHQDKVDKALLRFNQASKNLEKAIATFRTSQYGFKEELRNAILADLRKTKNGKWNYHRRTEN